MNALLLALVLVACDHGAQDRPAVAPAPAAPTSLPCGERTCSGSELCVEIHDPSGAAPAPGQPGVAIYTQCMARSPAGPGTDCGPIENRHQTCFQMKPSMAPPPPPPPPPAQPLACGELTCGAQEICIETLRGGGVAPPPGTNRQPAHHYRCAPSPEPECQTLDAHHQRCVDKIPSARPR